MEPLEPLVSRDSWERDHGSGRHGRGNERKWNIPQMGKVGGILAFFGDLTNKSLTAAPVMSTESGVHPTIVPPWKPPVQNYPMPPNLTKFQHMY